MTQLQHDGEWTFEDLELVPDDDHQQYELLGGLSGRSARRGAVLRAARVGKAAGDEELQLTGIFAVSLRPSDLDSPPS